MKGLYAFLALAMSVPGAWAAHPLVTDDAGTQGKGKAQLEFNTEFGKDRSGLTRTEEFGAQVVLSVGLRDSLDAVVGLPYQYWTTREPGLSAQAAGIMDAAMELKWRFLDAGSFSMALKPGLTFPTGDDSRGLGGGEPTYGLFLIASREFDSLGLHANAGYVRNENDLGEQFNHWHGSVAVTAPLGKKIQAVANAAFDHNHDPADATPLSAVLGGFIVNVAGGLDFDLGMKFGMSRPETDYTLLSGIAWRL